VVDDGIEHEPEIASEVLDIGPGAEVGIDLGVVDDGESVVGRVGEEGQNVHARHGIPHRACEYLMQGP